MAHSISGDDWNRLLKSVLQTPRMDCAPITRADAEKEMAHLYSLPFRSIESEGYRLRNSHHACATGSRNPNQPDYYFFIHEETPIIKIGPGVVNYLISPEREEEEKLSPSESTCSPYNTNKSYWNELFSKNDFPEPRASSETTAESDLLIPVGLPDEQDLNAQESMSDDLDSSTWEKPDVNEFPSSDSEDNISDWEIIKKSSSETSLDLSNEVKSPNPHEFLLGSDPPETSVSSFKIAETDSANRCGLLKQVNETRQLNSSSYTTNESRSNFVSSLDHREEFPNVWKFPEPLNKRFEEIVRVNTDENIPVTVIEPLNEGINLNSTTIDDMFNGTATALNEECRDQARNEELMSWFYDIPYSPEFDLVRYLSDCNLAPKCSQIPEKKTEKEEQFLFQLPEPPYVSMLSHLLSDSTTSMNGSQSQPMETLSKGIENIYITKQQRQACPLPQRFPSEFVEGPSTSSGITRERSLDSLGNSRVCIRFRKKSSRRSGETESQRSMCERKERKRINVMKRRVRKAHEEALRTELRDQEDRNMRLTGLCKELETSVEQILSLLMSKAQAEHMEQTDLEESMDALSLSEDSTTDDEQCD